jgi:hypothetical protein
MFKLISKTMKSALTRKAALLAAATMGVAGMTAPSAQAHERRHHDFFLFDIRVDSEPCRRWCPPVCEERVTRVWVEPVYRTVCDTVYDQPEYRCVVDRVWKEPVYRTTCERVWVPDRYEVREVRVVDYGRPHLERRRVLACSGHWDKVEQRVLVCDGHYENVERQVLVREGGYRKVERQDLVTPGHYETRTERVEVRAGHWEEGYASAGWDLRVRN